MQARRVAGQTDIGDYLKATACTLVMIQSVLGLGMAQAPTAGQQWGMGLVYDAVKFTAPAFIFGILYTILRHYRDRPTWAYRDYYRQQWHAMFVPTIWWTLAYLVVIPQVQEHQAYYDARSFLWQFVNGNAAPHLWYNSMMLQFIIVMPAFWWLARWCGTQARRSWWALGVTFGVYAAWLAAFPHFSTYLVDRICLSFLPYGVAGTLASGGTRWTQWLNRYRWGLLAAVAGAYGWLTWQLIDRGLPVQLADASYYQWSATLYSFAIILLIALVGFRQISRWGRTINGIHWLATYAYRAFLGHVFWLTLLWSLTTAWPLVPRMLTCYLGTWLLAFALAYGMHRAWSAVKLGVQKSLSR
ncbi:hypothetical protein DA798_04175 [Lactobacillus sp. PFC-70]|uniref:Acyltransferase family protein n=1 Tax=Levilactobacillus namurensis TaxID=380393 RepID=A0AAW8W6F6_9LACO|nr:acyltransferase family protein [Levilactobacillus namurensis]MDT7014757.1 acyltransferase family protein [Levilactobacillus namurensis]PTM23518.1 hypothetical protein DA798_04175 [Lactobacillus sp. PFC-70]